MSDPPHPEGVPLAHTLDWIDRALPPGVPVLEVGCGRGALARALRARGVDLTAIDADADPVAAARDRGVPALHADLLTFERPDESFGAVLFTRSLHHLHPLDAALDRARALLAPGGSLVLEEFAFERADEPTTAWDHDERTRLAGLGRVPDDAAGSDDPHAAWIGHHVHDHHVHEGRAMRVAIARRFEIFLEEDAPYLYRWFADRLPPDEDGAAAAAALFDAERAGIAAGRLRAIGMRLAARRV